MVKPHLALTRRRCVDQGVVLCVQDDTDLSSVKVDAEHYRQHSTLAVLPDGQLLGLLDARWFERASVPAGETRRQREARWRESCVWPEAVTKVGQAPEGCRFVHVADRAADDLNFIERCVQEHVGFVVRAQHDRYVNDEQNKLWTMMSGQPITGTLRVRVSRQIDKNTGKMRCAREATVNVRYAAAQLDRPQNDPGDHEAQRVRAIYVCEEAPPPHEDAIAWMLLTSESIDRFADAARIIGYYQRRWVIEEWHRAMKEGCQLEKSQLDEAADLQRLAALCSVVAVRLLQLRDLADSARAGARADDPAALAQAVPVLWRIVVAELGQCPVEALTPRQFWLTVARQGGFLGRKRDGRPGWKVIWRGWYELTHMIRGAQILQQTVARERCG